jgi:hypothetical protein
MDNRQCDLRSARDDRGPIAHSDGSTATADAQGSTIAGFRLVMIAVCIDIHDAGN